MESINTPQEVELLVDRAIAGDGDAFGKLYDMYMDRVYRHIYYRVGNAADAEDLTQQAFIKAWQAIGRYKRAATPFVVWLIKIGHNRDLSGSYAANSNSGFQWLLKRA